MGLMGLGVLCNIGVEDYYTQHGGTILQVQEVRRVAERRRSSHGGCEKS